MRCEYLEGALFPNSFEALPDDRLFIDYLRLKFDAEN